MSDSERFEIGGVGREVGIIDIKRKQFAPFLGDDGIDVRRRLEWATGRLNSGEDTPAGYVWQDIPTEKKSQPGTEERFDCERGA